jgi:hypothetical protein
MGDGTEQVIVALNAATLPPTFTITVRWDEPTPDGVPPSYSILVPVNPF